MDYKLYQSEQIGEISAALAKAQQEIKPAEKDAQNQFLKNKYATLESVAAACMHALNTNGIAVVQAPLYEGTRAGVRTLLGHSSGQWFAGVMFFDVNPEKGKSIAQVAGSIVSYARRYSLGAMAGVLTHEDDDGNAGSDPRRQQQPMQQQPPSNQPHPHNVNPADELKRGLRKLGTPEPAIESAYNEILNACGGSLKKALHRVGDFINGGYRFDAASNTFIKGE